MHLSLPNERSCAVAGRIPIDIEQLVAWAVLRADEEGWWLPPPVGPKPEFVPDPALPPEQWATWEELLDDRPPAGPATAPRPRTGGAVNVQPESDVQAVLAVIRRLRESGSRAAADLLVAQARLGVRPDTTGGTYEEWRTRVRHGGAVAETRWWLWDAPETRAAYEGVAGFVPVAVAADRRGNGEKRRVVYVQNRAKGFDAVWINRERELQQLRARYTLWRGALVALQAALTAPPTPLIRYWPTGPAAPAAPWKAARAAESVALEKTA